MLSVWFRDVLLWSCRLGGRVHGLLRRKLVLHLVLILAIAGALRGAEVLASRGPQWFDSVARRVGGADAGQSDAAPSAPPGPSRGQPPTTQRTPGAAAAAPQPGSWLTLWNVLSIWAFGFVVWSVGQARRRLTVAAFDDFSGKQAGMDVPGFGVLVAAELSRLSDLFTEFEADRAIRTIPEKMTPLNATFQTDAPGQFLQQAVSSETSFALGPLRVPVGTILGLVGRLVQGPVLTAQIHRDGDRRLVTARLADSRGERTFRIVDDALHGEGEATAWRPARDLAREVACRVFADVVMGGTVTWRALDGFAAGVGAYRDSLRASQARALQRREAEHRLLQTVAEDPRFDLAYYDLGVVYTEQQRFDSAAVAFARAIAQSQGRERWSAHYALALNSHRSAQQAYEAVPSQAQAASLHLSRALDHCERALQIATDPGARAQILSLKAAVLWWRAWRAWPDRLPAQTREFRDAGRLMRRAVSTGWWALCRAELGLGASSSSLAAERRRARQLASRYLQDLAEVALTVARFLAQVRHLRETEDVKRTRASLKEKLESVERDLVGAAGQRGVAGTWRRVALRLAKRMFRLSSGSNEIASWLQTEGLIEWLSLRVAARSLGRARFLTPEIAQVHLDSGVVCLERGRHRAARAALQTAVRMAPTSAAAWAHLARASARLQLFSEVQEAARRFFANLHEAAPDSLEALASAMDVHAARIAQWQAFGPDAQRRAQAGRGPSFRLWVMLRFMRVAFQMAERDVRQLKLGTSQLQQVIQNPGVLAPALDAARNAAARARTHPAFLREVEEARRQGREGLARLEALFSERQSAGQDWEAGHVGHTLSGVYDRLRLFDEAESRLRQTIDLLERTLPAEIQRRGLYTLLARVLRRKGRPADALALARIGILKDPVSHYERTELGWVHWTLAEFAEAQAAWEDAVRLNPDAPHAHLNLAWAHLRQLDDLKDRALRAEHHAHAAREVAAALALFAEEDEDRNRAQYFLARLHTLCGRHADAARELRALDQRDYCDLAVSIALADACLAKDDWGEAEQRFRRAAEEIEQRTAASPNGVDEPVEDPLGEEMVLGSAAAYARLGIAASFAAREIRLDEALSEIEQAKGVLQRVSDPGIRQTWLRACTFQEGVVLSKKDLVDEAIVRLESALAARADAEAFFVLANALVRKAELGGEQERAFLLRRSVRYYKEARKLDWTSELEGEIAASLGRIEALAAGPPGAPAAAVPA
jgi:tetratricopeptide (TPR) repeat protein